MLLFLELIGNDVCIHKNLDEFTKPEDFKANILKLFNHLDTTLPKGSHIWIFGMVDGRVLYDNLHSKIHPLNAT
jgi:acyloxyacyl hydrolase